MSRHRKRLSEPRRYSLTELEEHDWGPPNFHSSLVQSVHRLRNVPLGELTAGDLRLLIGQRVGLRHLVPVALDILAKEPLIEGTYYPGDLLSAIIKISAEFWETTSEMTSQAVAIARAALESANTADIGPEMGAELQRFIEARSRG
ncbi:MAG: contact-dependent growth inhibition system immunity protein [Planctomycetota bacterium]